MPVQNGIKGRTSASFFSFPSSALSSPSSPLLSSHPLLLFHFSLLLTFSLFAPPLPTHPSLKMFALRTLLAASLAALAFSATSSTAAPTSLQARDRFYRPTFIAQTCATSSPDYLTYSLVATPGACQNFCDSVNGCVFANSYNDINSQGQNGNNKGLAGNALLT